MEPADRNKSGAGWLMLAAIAAMAYLLFWIGGSFAISPGAKGTEMFFVLLFLALAVMLLLRLPGKQAAARAVLLVAGFAFFACALAQALEVIWTTYNLSGAPALLESEHNLRLLLRGPLLCALAVLSGLSCVGASYALSEQPESRKQTRYRRLANVALALGIGWFALQLALGIAQYESVVYTLTGVASAFAPAAVLILPRLCFAPGFRKAFLTDAPRKSITTARMAGNRSKGVLVLLWAGLAASVAGIWFNLTSGAAPGVDFWLLSTDGVGLVALLVEGLLFGWLLFYAGGDKRALAGGVFFVVAALGVMLFWDTLARLVAVAGMGVLRLDSQQALRTGIQAALNPAAAAVISIFCFLAAANLFGWRKARGGTAALGVATVALLAAQTALSAPGYLSARMLPYAVAASASTALMLAAGVLCGREKFGSQFFSVQGNV